MKTLLEKLLSGTGTPHFKSRVIQRLSKPPFSQLFAIDTAFTDH